METGSGYFLSSSALTLQFPTVEGKRIRCVRQKRSIKRNIELPVAIHEARDGQRSRWLIWYYVRHENTMCQWLKIKKG